jgi:hypothetical protein
MSIRVLKLKSGEEVIADLTGESEVGGKSVLQEELILGNPLSIHMMLQEDGIEIQLLPYAIYAKNHKNIVIKKENVMFCVEPSIRVRNQYAVMVGIPVIPDDTIIIPDDTIIGS